MSAHRTGDVQAEAAVVAVTGVVLGPITVGLSRYLLDEFPVSPPAVPAGVSLSHLLAARYAFLPFAGRKAELDDLRGWRDDPQRLRAARLVYGPPVRARAD
ncbi:hypothetical protein [Micromonospora sp. NPDC005806]|uniref:hypothetical protein n=1 Tax=Micromonospora sp. NPDC005806 TaxID=3364234 RepID=UPI00367C90FF